MKFQWKRLLALLVFTALLFGAVIESAQPTLGRPNSDNELNAIVFLFAALSLPVVFRHW